MPSTHHSYSLKTSSIILASLAILCVQGCTGDTPQNTDSLGTQTGSANNTTQSTHTTSSDDYSSANLSISSRSFLTSSSKPIIISSATLSSSAFNSSTPQITAPQWSAKTAYILGDRVSYNGEYFEAKWWNLNKSPAQFAGGAGQPWLALQDENTPPIHAASSTTAVASSSSSTQVAEPPLSPSHVISVASNAGDIMGISWQDNAHNEQGFTVERQQNDTPWTTLNTLAANVTSYADATITSDNTYQYRITAYNSRGTSSAISQSNMSNRVTIAAAASTEQQKFEQYCASCHLDGGIGGNLFDGFTRTRWQDKAYSSFSQKVASMPAAGCDNICLSGVSDYIWSSEWGFNTIPVGHQLQAGVRSLSKLTPYEYSNSIRAILKVHLNEQDLPKAQYQSHFKYPSQTNQGVFLEDHIQQQWALTENIVNQINLANIGCTNTQCTNSQLFNLAQQLLKRPLSTTEKQQYESINTKQGSRDALFALLLTPDFNYHSLLGTWSEQDKSYKLNAFEIASLLSFSLWGTPPDKSLFNLALTNELANETVIAEQIDRLINDERFGQHFVDFIRYYTHTHETVSEKPGLTQTLINAMQQEQALTVAAIINSDEPSVNQLFNPGYSFINAALANHYALNGPFSDNPIRTTTPSQRGGLLHMGLTHIANSDFAATSLVKRGKMMRENMLCHEMGVPVGVNPDAITLPNIAISTRERWNIITGPNASQGQCWQCHQLMNEPGSALEHFDQTGHYRTQEAAYNNSQLGSNITLTIDAAGTLRDNSASQTLTTYSTARELAEYLGQAPEVHDCFAESYFRYNSGHLPDVYTQTALSQLQNNLRTDNNGQNKTGNIKAFIRNLLLSPITLRRLEARQ